jgi:hypothetical protein
MTVDVYTPAERVAEAHTQLAQLHAGLATFEAQYAMSSELFYRFPHERQQFITAIKTTNRQSKKEHR